MNSNRHDCRGPRARSVAVAVFFTAFATGCASPGPQPQPGVSYPTYIVGAPDELLITILPEPAVIESAVVRPDGKITIQLIGEVQASGRTPREIGIEIEERIARFKRGARASVAVGAAASSAISVFGEVRGPGTFFLTRQQRIADLLGTAGGPTQFANLDGIRIVRPGAERTQVIPIDFGAIRSGDMATNVQVRPGDIVYVPPTIIARVGYFFQQILFPFQPLLGAAGSAVALGTN